MTTENSVRVPREALEFWERMLADGSTTTSSGLPVTVLEMIDVNQAIASEMRKHLAAPAPAGSLPEQGAGLAWPKPMDGRIEWLKRWSDQGQHRRIPGPSAGEAYELAIELEQLRNQWNALARQQSRVVDEGMIERARQCIVMLRHHLGLFVQDDIALAMFKTAEEIETELRAAAATMSMMI